MAWGGAGTTFGGRLLLAAACLALPLLFVRIARADESPGEGVRITADRLTHDQESDTYRADGHVVIRWQKLTLLSDTATFTERDGNAVAEGKVSLTRNGDILTSRRLSVNLLTEKGEAEDASLYIRQQNFYLRGVRLAKTGPADYRLDGGSFTTCDGPDPSWHFAASQVRVTLDEYATARNAVFYLGRVPVFYTPYLIFPVKRQRQSGFLFPRIGSSTLKGFSFTLPYYWAIAPNQDATVELDLQTRRGVGTGLEYRFLGRQEGHGVLNAYTIYDTGRSRERGTLALTGYQPVAPTLTLRSDLSLATDLSFYHDYGESSGEYNRQLLDSSASASWNWRQYEADVEARYVQDLQGSDNRSTLQRLPIVRLAALRQRLGPLPLYAGLSADATNFDRSEGERGERLRAEPELLLATTLPPGLDLSAWGGYLVRWYRPDATSAGENSTTGDALATAGASLSFPLVRIYDSPWGELRRLRNAVVPEVTYRYVQTRDQDRLPFFDYDDRPVGGELAGWGLSSYLTGRFDRGDGLADYRELLFVRLSQEYQISGGRRDLLNPVDDGQHWTDLRGEARFAPVRNVTVTLDSRFNVRTAEFSTTAIDADAKDGAGNLLGVGYHFIRDQVEYLEGRVGLSLVKPFVFGYTGRYSFDGGSFLESLYTLEFRRQCWSVNFTYRDRPSDREFLVSFTLGGIGSLGQVRAF